MSLIRDYIRGAAELTLHPWTGNVREDRGGESFVYGDPAPLEAAIGGDHYTMPPVPAAYAAVSLIASTLALLPKIVVDVDDHVDDQWTYRPRDAVNDLLRNPNPNYDQNTLWECVFADYAATGNGYAILEADNRGPFRISPAQPIHGLFDTATITGSRRRRDFYAYIEPGVQRSFENVQGASLLEFHGPGFNPKTGRSPSPITRIAQAQLALAQTAIRQQRENVSLGSAERYALQMEAAPGGRAGGKEDGVKAQVKLLQEVSKIWEEGKRKRVTPVVPPGVSPTKFGAISATDLQLIEVMRFGIEDFSRAFLVPVRMLQHFTAGVRIQTSFADQSEDFARWGIRFRSTRIQSQLGHKLLPESMREIRMPLDVIRRGTFAEEVTALGQAVQRRLLTPNEARARLRYPDVEGGDELVGPVGGPPVPGDDPPPDPPDPDGED